MSSTTKQNAVEAVVAHVLDELESIFGHVKSAVIAAAPKVEKALDTVTADAKVVAPIAEIALTATGNAPAAAAVGTGTAVLVAADKAVDDAAGATESAANGTMTLPQAATAVQTVVGDAKAVATAASG